MERETRWSARGHGRFVDRAVGLLGARAAPEQGRDAESDPDDDLPQRPVHVHPFVWTQVSCANGQHGITRQPESLPKLR